MTATFTYRGRDLEQFDHRYNDTMTNERAVEIAVALNFLDRRADRAPDGWGPALEVGNVLSHYNLAPRHGEYDWRIVDRYEHGFSGIDPIDVFAIEGSYEWIVSVSTLEHVRHDPPEDHAAWGAVAALAYLTTLLAPTGHMLVTLGLGQNAMLDRFLMRGESFGARSHVTLVRHRTEDPRVNDWRQTDLMQWEPYGPTHGANSVWIGEWGPS